MKNHFFALHASNNSNAKSIKLINYIYKSVNHSLDDFDFDDDNDDDEMLVNRKKMDESNFYVLLATNVII